MYGITGTELNWFSSCLNDRKKFVNFNNETSHPSPVKLHAVFHKSQFLVLFCSYGSLMAPAMLQ